MVSLRVFASAALVLWPTCCAHGDMPNPANSDCVIQATALPDGPRSFDCRRFVIESTDQTWHQRSWDATEAAIAKYYAEDWKSVGIGSLINGRSGLRHFAKQRLEGFPNVVIHVPDVFCEGNDVSGYKTTMPYVVTETNTGPSMFGPATGRSIRYHGIANCFIKKTRNGDWVYTGEWNVPDMWSMFVQLGFPMDRQKHPATDVVPIDQCKPLFEWGSGKMNWWPSLE